MSKYASYFEIHSRLAGQKKIAIVKSDCLPDFIKALTSDPDVDMHTKAFIFTALSGGLRVNEALTLTNKDFVMDEDGNMYAEVRVLKKRGNKNIKRTVRLHPDSVPLIQELLKTNAGKLFKHTERTYLNKVKAIIGLKEVCNHSLRHSLISYLLFEKDLNHLKAAKLIKIGVKSIEHYSHLNERRVLKSIF